MKVEYWQGCSGRWYWRTKYAECTDGYARRRDAERGWKRHCARVRAM